MLSAHQQEIERWNTRLIEVAENCSRAWTSKLDVDERGSLDDRDARDKTSLALAEQLVRVMLLFGVESAASQAAQDASRKLEAGRVARASRALEQIESVSVADQNVDPRIPFEQSSESHLRFMQAVHEVVRAGA